MLCTVEAHTPGSLPPPSGDAGSPANNTVLLAAVSPHSSSLVASCAEADAGVGNGSIAHQLAFAGDEF